MPWDAITKILQASNKFLFGLLLAALVVWQVDLGLPSEWSVAGLIVGVLCGGALVFELGANTLAFGRWLYKEWRLKKQIVASKNAAAAGVRQQKDDADAEERAKAEKAIATIADLEQHTGYIFELLLCRDEPRFFASRHHPRLQQLRNRGLIVLESDKGSVRDCAMLIPQAIRHRLVHKQAALRLKHKQWDAALRHELADHSTRI